MALVRLKLRMFIAFVLSSLVFFFFVWIVTYLLQAYLPSMQIATISHVPLIRSIPYIGVPLNDMLVLIFNSIMGPLFYPFIMTILFILIQYMMGPSIVGRVMKLKYIKAGENPWLEKTVSELAGESNLPTPKIAISPMKEPNAFTFGRTAKGATLAVTTGLLGTLNEQETRGVIGHELGHIKHKDYIMITILSALPLLAYMVSQVAFMSSYYGTGQSNSKNNQSGSLILLAGFLSLIVYFIFNLIVRAVSRTREFMADKYSAVITDNPRSLQSALVKISTKLSQGKVQSPGLRAFFIADPVNAQNDVKQLKDHGMLSDRMLSDEAIDSAIATGRRRNSFLSVNELFSTHPPVYKRLENLAEIQKSTKARAK